MNTEKTLRGLIREFASRADVPTILYHGTLRSNVSSILSTGLRAGRGWGEVKKEGVFLSSSPENAMYWAKMSLLAKIGLNTDSSMFDELEDRHLLDQLAILRVEIPAEFSKYLVPRITSFARPDDMQFEGPVPPEWISVES